MKWFKHMTNSSLDERLARFTDKYGLEAYGFFWRVLEAIAENVDETDRKHVEYSTKTWCKLLGIRPQTFRKLISESSVLGLFQVSFNSDLITVESSNILKYRDEWTRKKRKTPEQNSEKEEEKDKEKEREGSARKFSPEIVEFVTEFQTTVQNELGNQAPAVTESLLARGCDTVEKLVRIDCFALDDVKGACWWALHDDFWSKNARSLAVLRKKGANDLTKFQNLHNDWIRSDSSLSGKANQFAGAI